MKKTVVILHGWRLSGDRYQAIKEIFEDRGYLVLSPDLPGFGKEKINKSIMYIDDYVDFVVRLLKKLHITKAIFIGHSFGARISAKLAAKHPEFVEKLILTGAPLIRQKLSLKKRVLVKASRIGKKIISPFPQIREISQKIMYQLLGEWDYFKASAELKETLKAIIREDLSIVLPEISAPTLVLWGQNDTFVSNRIGKEITRRITGAIYKEIPGGTHKLPYESPDIFAKEVLGFVE